MENYNNRQMSNTNNMYNQVPEAPIYNYSDFNPDTSEFNIPQPNENSNMPSSNMPSNNMPSNNMPSNNMPSNNMPSNNMPSNNMPSNNMPSNNMPSNIMPSNNMSNMMYYPPDPPIVPAVRMMPTAPSMPTMPTQPTMPTTPSMPSMPTTPSMPSMPSTHRHMMPEAHCYGKASEIYAPQIKQFINSEYSDYLYYSILSQKAPKANAKRIFSNISRDELRHSKKWGTAYFLITGERYVPSRANIEPVVVPTSYAQALRQRYIDEMSDVAKYSNFAASVTDDRCLKKLATDISEDELQHANLILEIMHSM